MPSIPGGVPAALGRVSITTATTPETILKNFADVDTEAERVSSAWSSKAKSILVQALSTNTGIVYVGKTGMVVSSGVGVLAELAAGQSIVISAGDNYNLLNLADFQLDVSVSAESAYVSAIQV